MRRPRAANRAKRALRKRIASILAYRLASKKPWGTATLASATPSDIGEGRQAGRLGPRAPERRGADRRHRRGRDRLRRRRGAELGAARRRGRARARAATVHARADNHGERVLREVESVANSDAAYRKHPRRLRSAMGAGLCRPAAAVLLRPRLRLRGRRRPTSLSTPRSATAASIRTGSTRSGPSSRRCSISCAAARAAMPTRHARSDAATMPASAQPRGALSRTFWAGPRSLRRSRSPSAGEPPTEAATARPIVSERQIHRRRCAGRDRLAAAVAQPAPARQASRCRPATTSSI